MRYLDHLQRKVQAAFVVVVILLVSALAFFSLLNADLHAQAGKPPRVPTNTFVPPSATPPPGPTPGPCTTCNGSLPKHVLTGYWQDFTNGATPLRLRDVPTSYGLVAVAFAGAGTPSGTATFSLDAKLSTALGGYTITDFKADVQTLHSQGRKVIISVGGATGTISINDANSATAFANSVYGLMTTYGFDGVDIDLESGINVASLTSALQQLSTKAGPSLIITLAPQTLDVQPGGAYLQLAINIKSILTIVNTQYYNSGRMWGCDNNLYDAATENFETALACILLQNGLRGDQVGLGLPASTSAAGSGYVSPSVVNNALDCLATGTNCGTFHPALTYPTIRGAMTWSINWDASNNYQFATNVSGHFGLLP